MTIPSVTSLPDAPLRSETPATFTAKAEAWVEALTDTFTPEMNAAIAAINALVLESGGATEASASEIWTGTETAKYISPDKLFDSAAPVTLTAAATAVAVDMNAGINFNLTLGGNWTISAPTNVKAGQSGRIRVTQDGTGGRTLSWESEWKHVGSAPTISTTAGAVNIFTYFVNASGDIELSYAGALV